MIGRDIQLNLCSGLNLLFFENYERDLSRARRAALSKHVTHYVPRPRFQYFILATPERLSLSATLGSRWLGQLCRSNPGDRSGAQTLYMLFLPLIVMEVHLKLEMQNKTKRKDAFSMLIDRSTQRRIPPKILKDTDKINGLHHNKRHVYEHTYLPSQ